MQKRAQITKICALFLITAKQKCTKVFEGGMGGTRERRSVLSFPPSYPRIPVLYLGEVFYCADHLAGVAVFVVVPSDYLDFVEVVGEFFDHSLSGVKE